MRQFIVTLTRVGFASIWASALASPAIAQLRDGSPVFVVDVSDARNRVVVVSVSTFNQALYEKPPDGEVWGTPIERAIDACSPKQEGAAPSAEAAAARQHVIDRLQGCVDCLKAHQEKRFMTKANDEVALFVLFKAPLTPEEIRPFFRESPRESELVATAKAIAKLVREAGIQCRAFTYTLQRKRSRFKVTIPKIGLPAEGAETVSRPANPDPLIETSAADATGRLDIETPEVILGPPERWIFSTDFSVSASELELTETPEADAERVKNKDFFIALNFALGDLLVDRDDPLQRRSIWNELLFKLQVTPSREPWSAWAFGVGLRGYRIKTILWNMDVAHPYFTFGRQTVNPDAEKGTAAQRRWRAVFGLGFDPRSLKK